MVSAVLLDAAKKRLERYFVTSTKTKEIDEKGKDVSKLEKIGMIVQEICSKDNVVSPLMFEHIGNRLVEELKKRGMYINEARGDVSGRW